jgi:AcrR family transcriptional regulator
VSPSKRGARPVSNPPSRRLRSDAATNRARILQVAAEVFDQEGVTVSLDEIARRAGVGAGTLHRHFPTKAALIDATLADRVRALAAEGAELTKADDPTAAFTTFVATIVERGAASHALADRLRLESGDIDAAVAEPLAMMRANLGRLLRRAQRAGGIRRDVDLATVDAVIAGGHALVGQPGGHPRLLAALIDALRTDEGGAGHTGT